MSIETATFEFLRAAVMIICCLVPRMALANHLSVDVQYGDIGDIVSYSVVLEGPAQDVDAFGFDIGYDPRVLRYTQRYYPAGAARGFEFFDVVQIKEGRLRVGGFTTAAPIAAGDTTTIVTLDFEVMASKQTALSLTKMVDDLRGVATQGGTFVPYSALEEPVEQEIGASGEPIEQTAGAYGSYEEPRGSASEQTRDEVVPDAPTAQADMLDPITGERADERSGVATQSGGSVPYTDLEGPGEQVIEASGFYQDPGSGAGVQTREAVSHEGLIDQEYERRITGVAPASHRRVRGEPGQRSYKRRGVENSGGTGTEFPPTRMIPNKIANGANPAFGPLAGWPLHFWLTGLPVQNGLPTSSSDSGEQAINQFANVRAESFLPELVNSMLSLALLGAIVAIFLQRKKLNEQAAYLKRIERYMRDVDYQLKNTFDLHSVPH